MHYLTCIICLCYAKTCLDQSLMAKKNIYLSMLNYPSMCHNSSQYRISIDIIQSNFTLIQVVK